jgi:hypothetical protein
MAVPLDRAVVVSTIPISLEEAEKFPDDAKAEMQKHDVTFGTHREAAEAMRTCLAWDIVYDPENAFPEETVPKYLIRDRDSIYGQYFRQRIKNLGIKEVIIAPRSPWQISMWSGLSALFGVSAWIMSLFSAKIICGKHCGNILNITIKSERISPWTETHRSLETLSDPLKGKSFRFQG